MPSSMACSATTAPSPKAGSSSRPVEWGVWSYLAVRTLATLARATHGERTTSGHLGHAATRPGLLLDRVGPDPFDPTGLGAIVTLRWSVRAGSTTGTVRLWLPESVLDLVLRRSGPAAAMPADVLTPRSLPDALSLSSLWRGEAGSIAMPQWPETAPDRRRLALCRLPAHAALPRARRGRSA